MGKETKMHESNPNNSELLKHRIRYEKGLANCSRALLENDKRPVLEALEHLLRASQVSRVYIFENYRNRQGEHLMSQTYETVKDGVSSQMENPKLQAITYFPEYERWWDNLSNKKPIKGLIADFPEQEKPALKEQNILSILVLPIFVDGGYFGFIGFDDCEEERRWSQDDIRLLKTGSDLIGAYLSRKKVKEKLKKERKLFLSVLNNISEIIYVVDPATYEILFINDYFKRILGKNPVGQICYQELQGFDSPCEFCKNEKIKNLGGKPLKWEFHHERFDSDYLIIDRMIKWPDGRDVKLEIATNITKLKKMEKEVWKNRNFEALGLLAGGLAHDYNNILTGIFGNLSLMEKIMKSDRHTRLQIPSLIQDAKDAAKRAASLTKQLLTFSKGGAPIKKEASMESIVKESSGFLLSGTEHEIIYQFQEDLWDVLVDKSQVSQVIQNLIINAKEAMKVPGKIIIKGKNIALSEENRFALDPGRYISISIQDTGPGIPSEILPKIFDLYFSTKNEGNGLGLSLSLSIIKRHGGTIVADSKIDEGANFTFFLPALPQDKIEERKRQKDEKKMMKSKKDRERDEKLDSEALPDEFISEQSTEDTFENGKILVMDDNPTICKSLDSFLDFLGYETVCVHDGEQAIEAYSKAMIQEKPFDFVILDLVIPGGMGGEETIKKMLKIDPEVSAIVSSGYVDKPILSNYKEYGFKERLNKPYSIDELEEVLGKLDHSS